jgi:hypothetical protein
MENSLRRTHLYRGLICPRRRVCPEWPGDQIRYGGGAGRSTNSAVRRRLPFVLRRRGNGNVVASKNRSVAFRNESRWACYGAFRKADTVCVLLGCHHDAATLEVLRPHRTPLLSTRACRVACKGTARRSSISGRLYSVHASSRSSATPNRSSKMTRSVRWSPDGIVMHGRPGLPSFHVAMFRRS